MSSTALAVSAADLPTSFDVLERHLRISTYAAPQIITQEPGVGAQFALAMMHLGFALVLIWHVMRGLPGQLHAAAHDRLCRVPRTALLALSTSGAVGWAWAFTLTILFIWR
jgi:hypothetical protein